MMRAAALVMLGLAGCGDQPVNPGARPVLRADSGGSAVLMIIACPPTEARAFAIGELIQLIANHEELLIARNGGSVRMTINGCPFGPLERPPVPPATRRR
jgi:hypothetical protein